MVLTIISVLALAPFACAYDSVEFFSGFMSARLEAEETSYEAVPLLVSFNFPAGNVIRDAEFPRLEFCAEPFIAIVVKPGTNLEAGANFLARYAFTTKRAIEPYLKAGIGIVYITQKTENQKEGLNFLPQAGLGLSMPLREDLALSLEYRFRHLSNAVLGKPNSGIDAHMFIAGLRYAM